VIYADMDKSYWHYYNAGMQFYPLKFRPIYKQRIWGGQKLREFFNKDVPRNEKIGESWELADLPNDKSIIANGELAGKTINQAVAKYPEEITGDKTFSGQFPLLVKFLDVEDVLSIQVHPDRQTCQRMGKGEPKTECWYVIYAEPGAVIYKGLKKGVTKNQFAEAIKKNGGAELVAKVPVEAGQYHFLPAGTVHSIGPGLLVAEIQTPSDTTYRIFDWNRLDENNKPRPLHIKEALQSVHFGVSTGDPDEIGATTSARLIDCEYFKMDNCHQVKGYELLLSPGKMKTLIILSGWGIIIGGNETSIDFRAGEVMLIPAAYKGAMRFAEDTQYLTVIV
jgi:mannose-6-phosphate isomerase